MTECASEGDRMLYEMRWRQESHAMQVPFSEQCLREENIQVKISLRR